MSKFTKEMVDSYAEKLLIGLTDEENKLVLDEMDIIEETMNNILKIKDIEKVEPMTHCLDDFYAELRDDVASESNSIEDILSNCDKYEDREIVVPKVVDTNVCE